MRTEFAGAIEIEPPLTDAEIESVRRLAGGDVMSPVAWVAAREGSTLRPRGDVDVETAVTSLRWLVGVVRPPSRLRGTVAAYDVDAGELVAITVTNGRVTVRRLRRSGATPRSNVIDLATRRSAVSRAID